MKQRHRIFRMLPPLLVSHMRYRLCLCYLLWSPERPPIRWIALRCVFYGYPSDKTLVGNTQEFIEDPDAWYVVVKHHHKTISSAGYLGRYIPPELKAVQRKVIKFGCETRNLFLAPPREKTQHIAVHKLVREWAKVYTPGCQYPEPTLIRKTVETEIAAKKNVDKAARMNKLIPKKPVDAEEASTKAARMAGHKYKTAKIITYSNVGIPKLMP